MIKIHNDGKGKHMSWEATLEMSDWLSINVTAYGETEEKAIENLKSDVQGLIWSLNHINFDSRILVDWKGDTI